MSTNGPIWDYIDHELKRFRPAIHRAFTGASATLRTTLQYDDYVTWANEGVSIAKGSGRASEAAAEFFKASVPMLQRLRFVQFLQWCRFGQSLLQLSPAIAAAYYRASPAMLGPLLIDEFEYWVGAGRQLSRDSWRGQSLAAQFFDSSPHLVAHLSVEEMAALASFIDQLSRYSVDSAAGYLERAGRMVARIDRRDRIPVLRIGKLIAAGGARPARAYADAVPEVLARFAPANRQEFLTLVERSAGESPEQALALFVEGSKSLARVEPESIGRLLASSERLAAVSPSAGIAFLESAQILLPKLGHGQLERWLQIGQILLASNRESGLAYFRLQSQRSHRTARALSHVCELEGIKQVLRLYSKALTGRDVQVRPASELAGKAIGWTSVEQATSDGSSIFLPSVVEAFPSRDDNFAFYKVLATHQSGHIEFGTYDFSCQRPPAVLERKLPGLLPPGPSAAIGEFERFFDLFPDRRLAKHVFNVLEDGRVDTFVVGEYPGLRATYHRVQQHALKQRPFPFSLPLRQACLEQLAQLSLSPDRTTFLVPFPLNGVLRAIVAVAMRLWRQTAKVEDSAEATILVYDIVASIPNVTIRWSDMVAIDPLGDLSCADVSAALRELRLAIGQADLAEEDAFEAPDEVDYRGALKPELVQALAKLRQERPDAEAPGAPISPEQLQRLLEKNANIEISAVAEDTLVASLGLFVQNLMREKGKAQQRKRRTSNHPPEDAPAPTGPISVDSEEVASYRYDEWDFRPADYRPGWCRVSERLLNQGDLSFYQDTLRDHAGLAQLVRKQFEMLRPDAFKKIKRLQDGEEFDLDALVEALVAKRSGHTPSEKVYWRRNKVRRDVAVAFLLDMSASTDDEIERLAQPDEDENLPPRRGPRIIDLEKKSVVLLTQAMEAIGDTYGIYGFSGYGHENCEFYVVKDLHEEFGDPVKRRIDKIVPMRGTRMGAAIRHATAKLAAEEARLRILILLSDGYPQDHDYDGDRSGRREYALHDTKMALLEAKRKNIVPFCLTVDKSGHDYLKMMCPDIGYEIVNDIRSLPRRLPALYRVLTT